MRGEVVEILTGVLLSRHLLSGFAEVEDDAVIALGWSDLVVGLDVL